MPESEAPRPAVPDPVPESGIDAPTIRTRGSASAGRSNVGSAGKAPAAVLPEPGQRLDSFEMEGAIGAGGMGAVFRARDLRLDRVVALKILPPEQAHDSEILRRFYQEGQSAARLDHENIARVYSIGSDLGLHYIAFEFIDGPTLRQRVERGGVLPIDEAINFTLQIAGALVHASERGVVHRDIKPSNIIVTAQGRAKLVDMGLARRFERGSDGGLTQSGMTLGTFDYISPEQARDPRDVDVRSDLYSLGCTLFYMLTGRPPFPDGTVLQKLLQHQEDAPPDVRSINPEVPPDLAVILAKLMVKDRDRRYQTPEQLIRDLLTLAGALGLRSISPEGLVWMATTPRQGWERHLVWGLPSIGLATVVAGLIWSGQPADNTPPPLAPDPPPALVDLAGSTPISDPGNKARPSATQAPRPRATTEAAAGPAVRTVVRTGDELRRALEAVPPGSTISLADDGPFEFGLGPDDRDAAIRLIDRDLAIRAADGFRPTLKLTREGAAVEVRGDSALLAIVGGRVVLEGLTFLADPGDSAEPLDLIRVEDADLRLSRCLFPEPEAFDPIARIAAIHARARKPIGLDDRPAPLVVDASHFGGGLVGLLAEGPVDVTLRDCTLAEPEPAFWLDGTGETPAYLRLRHVSVQAGEGPVFRLLGLAPRIRVDDSVFAPIGDRDAELVATPDPEGLDWLGRSNLYGRIGTFLRSPRDMPGRVALARFEAWEDDPSSPREVDSIAEVEAPWAEPDLASTPDPDDPTRAFRLEATRRPAPDVGARRGPFGPIVASLDATDPRSTSAPAPGASPPGRIDLVEAADDEPFPMPMPMDSVPMSLIDDEPDLPASPDRIEPGAISGRPGAVGPTRDGGPSPTPGPPVGGETDPDLIRTAEQFLAALGQHAERSGTLRLAPDADLELPSLEFADGSRWEIRSGPGVGRPRIRFRPDQAAARSARDRPALFRLRAGSLRLHEVDVVLPRAWAPPEGGWGAFAVEAGTMLDLDRCTVTIEGDDPRASLVVVGAGGGPDGAAADLPAAFLRATESLLRSGGDLADVGSGSGINLELGDTVVAAGGSLLHGHGAAVEPPRLELELRRVAARCVGGLILLESTPDRPELPVADVVARYSLLATTPDGDPLVRVDGQDAPDDLLDRIRWEGRGIAYHQIDTFRRDQTAQVGILPIRYDRAAWEIAVAPRDESPIYDDSDFAPIWDGSRPAWSLTAADFRLDPDSPSRTAGPDLARIPSPARPDRS